MKFRVEKDTLGSVKVPENALYGAQTERALLNFGPSRVNYGYYSYFFVRAIATVKKAAAQTNKDLGLLSAKKAQLIIKAADEVLEGKHSHEFLLGILQSGSGTQSNMNMNEVLANRAIQLANGKVGSKKPVHPNDDVNMGQSSNDVIPTAMHVATVLAADEIIVILNLLAMTLRKKSKEFKEIIKVGRTHLMDATPLTLGAEFSGYATQVKNGIVRIKSCLPHLKELALGGTAVGTGLNTHPQFTTKTVRNISKITKQTFKSAPNKYEAIAAHDALVQFSGTLKTVAVSLLKIANDIRLLSSGPRCGLNELILPANEPGSSIMPGKVNPSQCESMMMACAKVIGNDTAVSIAGAGGNLELNTFKPLIIYTILDSIDFLAESLPGFTFACISEIKPNKKQIQKNLENSLMLVTVLNKHIGYDKAALIAQKAYTENKTLKEAAAALGFVTEKQFDKIAQPQKMLKPSK
ncbi:MAG: class II fumarate hydratase [Candidatus Aceula meridiana]|nr:class II fumarate hydratase [Candidatus Aceula meridiana]